MSIIHLIIGIAALVWFLRKSAAANKKSGSLLFRMLRGLFRGILHLIPIVGFFLAVRDGAKAGFEEADSVPPSGMSKDEARQILGVDPNAKKADVQEAYKRLMLRNHPDGGGTDYLASKINQARDVLLKG